MSFGKSLTPLLAHDPGPVPSASYLAILPPSRSLSLQIGEIQRRGQVVLLQTFSRTVVLTSSGQLSH